jgi:hypothetical protein
MRQSPTALNEASDAEKYATIPNSKLLGPTSLPVLPVEDNNANPKTVENKAELVATLEKDEKAQECNIAVLKAKLYRYCCNNLSSRTPNPVPSTSAPRPPRKAPNPAAKNNNCRYCGQKGHFQLDCNDRHCAGAPMVGANGVPYSQSTPTLRPTPSLPPCSPQLRPLPLARARLYTIQIHMLTQI